MRVLLENILTSLEQSELLVDPRYAIANYGDLQRRRLKHRFVGEWSVREYPQLAPVLQRSAAWYDANLTGWWVPENTAAHTMAALLDVI
jgi:hypothetical protein